MTSVFKEHYESVNGVVNHIVSRTTEYVVNLDPTSKYIILFYIFLTFINFSVCTYNDGKEALLVYRCGSKINQAIEWKKVRAGCFMNAYEHVYNSLIWPITFSLNVMPWVIIYTSGSVQYSTEPIDPPESTSDNDGNREFKKKEKRRE